MTQPLLWTVDGILTPAECDRLLEELRERPWEAAPITTPRGPVMRPDLRNNQRYMVDDPPLAQKLFERVRPSLPPRMKGREVLSANERLRYYRYEPGQQFGLHADGWFERNPRERSLLTFMVYLNDDFTGGSTDFPTLGRSVTPKAGRALLFQHKLLHQGSVVQSGVKFVLRSDILYRTPTALDLAPPGAEC